jgi:thiol-disulfide isomerase/thioredoxin
MKHLTLLAIFIAATCLSSMSAQTSLTQAVDFTVTDLGGNDHNLFEYLDAGQYVCIDFFAYWCGPCQTTAPEFNVVYHDYGCNAGEVTFLSIEYEGTDALTHDFETSFAGAEPPPAASGADGGGAAVHAAYGIAAFPTYILIDPTGAIVEQDIWPMDAQILSGVLDSYNIAMLDCTVDVNDVDDALRFTAFPVPANDMLQVVLPVGGAQVELLNLLGQRVLQMSTDDQNLTLDVAELPVGSYVLRVISAGDIQTKNIQLLR